MQSQKNTILESITNTVIGYILALITTMIVFPIWGLETSISDEIGITACFTAVTLVRNYFVRRFFTVYVKD